MGGRCALKLPLYLALALIGILSIAGVVRFASVAGAGNINIGGTATPTATRTTIGTRPVATPTPAPPPKTPTDAAVGPGVMVSQCLSTDPNSVRVIFLWTPSQAGIQYLDLSAYNNDFAPGTFLGLGAFAPGAWGVVWDGLAQGTTHFARVDTLSATGWHASQTLAFYTPICNVYVSAPYPGSDMLALRDNIADAIAGTNIDTAVAITDLRTGETVDVNGYARRLPGCTINLFGLMRVAMDLQVYKYPEPEPGDLIGQTINRSDPITARRLMRDWVGDGDLATGMTRVNDFMHALGMGDTLLDHPPAFPEESLYGAGPNRITARDVNRGLAALWDGRVLAPFWRDYMLYKMTLVKPGLNYLIPVGVSAGATASHKNGFLYQEGWADDDIGIVWYERGGERYGYAISFFTENVAHKYDDIPLGQQISSLAYGWFVSRYGYP